MIKEIMPREKALEYGISSLSNNELLALILKSGYKNRNVFEIVDDILDISLGFENLMKLSYEELINIKGISTAKALELLAILEIAKRLAKIDVISEKTINAPEKVVEWLRFNLGFSCQEEFYVIYLSQRGKVLKSETICKGSKDRSIVAIDEIFRKGILLKASGIIVAHNHPSGDCKPSHQDILVTDKLKQVGEMVGIPLLDHLIVSSNNYFSFKSNALC